MIVAQEGQIGSEGKGSVRERVLPDGTTSYAVHLPLPRGVDPASAAGGYGEPLPEEDEQPRLVEEWEHLDGFLQRYNKVLVDRVAIEREKGRLEKENEDLRTLLKQYLDGISVNENVINNPANPLFIVNGKLQLNHKAAPPAAGPQPADPRKPKTLQYSNPAAVVLYQHGGGGAYAPQ